MQFIQFTFCMNFSQKRKYLVTIKLYLPFFLLLILIPSGYLVRNILTYKTPLCFSIPYIGKLFDNSQCKLDKFEEKYNFVGQAIPIGTEASAFSIGLMNYLEFAYANTFLTDFTIHNWLDFILLEKR